MEHLSNPDSDAVRDPVALINLISTRSFVQQPVSTRFIAWLAWVFLALYVTVTGFALLAEPVGIFDDAIPLLHGLLINAGKIPNVDFKSFYPPLGLYADAAAFTVLGQSVLAARIVSILIYGLFLVVAARCLRGWFVERTWLRPLAISLLAVTAGPLVALPSWNGLALSLIALFVFLLSMERENDHFKAGVAGTLAGIAVCFRANFGVYVGAVVVCDLLFGVLSTRTRQASFNAGTPKAAIRKVVVFAACFVVTATCILLLIFGKHTGLALGEFVVKSQSYMKLRFLDLTGSPQVLFALSVPHAWVLFRILNGRKQVPLAAAVPVALLGLVILTAFALRHSAAVVLVVVALQFASVLILHLVCRPLGRAELCILCFFCCLTHYYLSRSDSSHWVPLFIPTALLVLSIIIPGTSGDEHENVPVLTSVNAVAVMSAGLFILLTMREPRLTPAQIISGVRLSADMLRTPHRSDTDRILGNSLPGRGWSSVYPDSNELDAIRYVRAHTFDSDPVFVGVTDHARVYVNDLRIYWLIGRPIGVKLFQLETYVASEAGVQNEMIGDLQRNNVQWIILETPRSEPDEKYVHDGYVGSGLLDTYIAAHFHEAAKFGRYGVWNESGGVN